VLRYRQEYQGAFCLKQHFWALGQGVKGLQLLESGVQAVGGTGKEEE
jgi:hypothetical protein